VNASRGWTFISAWFWFFLPVAIYFFRKARREVDQSAGRYEWSPSFVERPVVLTLTVWGVFAALLVLLLLSGYGDPGPTGSR
jgi:hypothetical protein